MLRLSWLTASPSSRAVALVDGAAFLETCRRSVDISVTKQLPP
jgi:hypothetical protein